MRINIAAVEDDDGVVLSLKCVLKREEDFAWSAEYCDAESALKRIPAMPPDLVLMDIQLPGMNGIECTRRLKWLIPATKIVMLTAFHDVESVLGSIEAGADGFLCKSDSLLGCASTIREAMTGGTPLSGRASRTLFEWIRTNTARSALEDQLTRREREVMLGLEQGLSDKEIGQMLGVAPSTVHAHVRSVCLKLGVHGRQKAVAAYHNQADLNRPAAGGGDKATNITTLKAFLSQLLRKR